MLLVPVEHRRAGLERRTFKPALAVLALALLTSIALPANRLVVEGTRRGAPDRAPAPQRRGCGDARGVALGGAVEHAALNWIVVAAKATRSACARWSRLPLTPGQLSDYSALVELEARGLVIVELSGDTVRLAHPLYGEVLRRELPRLRARAHRLRVAETLQARAPLTPAYALRVARLLLDAGAPIPRDLRVDAARAATLTGDPELGVQFAEPALANGSGLPAALVLARAHTVRKRYEPPRSCWPRSRTRWGRTTWASITSSSGRMFSSKA